MHLQPTPPTATIHDLLDGYSHCLLSLKECMKYQADITEFLLLLGTQVEAIRHNNHSSTDVNHAALMIQPESIQCFKNLLWTYSSWMDALLTYPLHDCPENINHGQIFILLYIQACPPNIHHIKKLAKILEKESFGDWARLIVKNEIDLNGLFVQKSLVEFVHTLRNKPLAKNIEKYVSAFDSYPSPWVGNHREIYGLLDLEFAGDLFSKTFNDPNLQALYNGYRQVWAEEFARYTTWRQNGYHVPVLDLCARLTQGMQEVHEYIVERFSQSNPDMVHLNLYTPPSLDWHAVLQFVYLCEHLDHRHQQRSAHRAIKTRKSSKSCDIQHLQVFSFSMDMDEERFLQLPVDYRYQVQTSMPFSWTLYRTDAHRIEVDTNLFSILPVKKELPPAELKMIFIKDQQPDGFTLSYRLKGGDCYENHYSTPFGGIGMDVQAIKEIGMAVFIPEKSSHSTFYNRPASDITPRVYPSQDCHIKNTWQIWGVFTKAGHKHHFSTPIQHFDAEILWL